MNSPFTSWMARLFVDYPERLEGIEKDHDEMMVLLANKGNEHEVLFLGELKQQYGPENIAVINPDLSTAEQATKDAMDKGLKLYFRPTLNVIVIPPKNQGGGITSRYTEVSIHKNNSIFNNKDSYE